MIKINQVVLSQVFNKSLIKVGRKNELLIHMDFDSSIYDVLWLNSVIVVFKIPYPACTWQEQPRTLLLHCASLAIQWKCVPIVSSIMFDAVMERIRGDSSSDWYTHAHTLTHKHHYIKTQSDTNILKCTR